MYDKLVSGQYPGLQSRFPGVLSDVLPLSNKTLHDDMCSGVHIGPCLRGSGGVEQLLQRPLAFAGEVAVLEFLLLFICTLPHVTKLQQWMRNLPAPDTLKVSI